MPTLLHHRPCARQADAVSGDWMDHLHLYDSDSDTISNNASAEECDAALPVSHAYFLLVGSVDGVCDEIDPSTVDGDDWQMR